MYPLACLQGMAGLREYEACHLRACDVDFTAKTVTVAKTPAHTPKNRGSYRTIPATQEALKAVAEYQANAKVLSTGKDAPLFLSPIGREWTANRLCDAWRDTMKAARLAMELPEGFTAHNLRATFATITRSGLADREVLKRYMGHVASDVLGEHYEDLTVDLMRENVVNTFERQYREGIAIAGKSLVTSNSAP